MGRAEGRAPRNEALGGDGSSGAWSTLSPLWGPAGADLPLTRPPALGAEQRARLLLRGGPGGDCRARGAGACRGRARGR